MNKDNETLNFKVEAENTGMRLDIFLSENIEEWSRSRLKKLIDEGDVLVNKKPIKSSYKLRENDEIIVELIEQESDNFEPEDIPLDIVFEDEYLAVINKPAGMVVHPGAGISSGTLANALAFKFRVQSSEFRGKFDEQSKIQNLKSKIGMVHRLDKDTSGLIIVAKNNHTHDMLSKQFREREVYKSYVALVHGYVRKTSGKIDQPIDRDRYNRVKMSVSKTGRNAISTYKVRQRFEKFTLLDVEIKTGRTHQIRVHLGFLNHPVVGDSTYNEGRDNTVADIEIRQAIAKFERFFLHAEKLSFTHPVSKKKLDFVQPLPIELTDLLKIIQ